MVGPRVADLAKSCRALSTEARQSAKWGEPRITSVEWGILNPTMYYVYILKSTIDQSKYIGTTSDLKNRLREHNNAETKSNKSKIPYKITWYCAFTEKPNAYAFEKYLKSSSGYAFTNKHLI